MVDILKRKLDTAEEKFSKLEHMYKDAILKAAQRYKTQKTEKIKPPQPYCFYDRRTCLRLSKVRKTIYLVLKAKIFEVIFNLHFF